MPRIRYLAQLCLYRLTLVCMKYWPLYELCIFGCNPSTPPVHHQIGLSAYRFEVISSRTHSHVHRDPERICSAFAFPPPSLSPLLSSSRTDRRAQARADDGFPLLRLPSSASPGQASSGSPAPSTAPRVAALDLPVLPGPFPGPDWSRPLAPVAG